MWTWWFIGRDDEAPHLPEEEEGDRPGLALDVVEPELRALGEVLGAAYEPRTIFVISEHRSAIDTPQSIARIPEPFVRALAAVIDVASVIDRWRAACDSLRARDVPALVAHLEQMRDFAAEAMQGPGILAFRET
jgi:hypothetical protein